MNKTGPSYSIWASQVITYVTRSTVAFGVPSYLSLRMGIVSSFSVPGNPLLTAALVVISGPPAVVFGLGAVEGTARSCIAAVKYIFSRAKNNDPWNELCKEASTTQGLCRLALSPYSAYRYIFFEERVQSVSSSDTVFKKTTEGTYGWEPAGDQPILYPQNQANSASYESGKPVRVFDISSYRDIKKEYFVYRAPIAFGKGIWQLMSAAYAALCWGGRQLSWALHKGWEFGCYTGNKIADFTSFVWNAIKPKIHAVWKASEPLRQLLGTAVKKIFWDFAVKTIIWPILKVVGNFIKFVWSNIVLPILKGVGTIIVAVVAFALGIIGWATQQFFKRGK